MGGLSVPLPPLRGRYGIGIDPQPTRRHTRLRLELRQHGVRASATITVEKVLLAMLWRRRQQHEVPRAKEPTGAQQACAHGLTFQQWRAQPREERESGEYPPQPEPHAPLGRTSLDA